MNVFLRIAMLAAMVLLGLAAPAPAQDIALPEPAGMDGDPTARIVLEGNAAFVHGDLRRAAADYRSALAHKPDFAIASFNLGMVEAHEGNRARGLADMDRGIRLAMSHRMAPASLSRLRALRAAFAGEPVAT